MRQNGRVPTSSQWIAFVIASVLFIQVPGPSLLFTIGRALTVGRRDALLSVVGNSWGIVTQALATAVGLGAVVAAVVALLALQADAFGTNCPRQEKHVMKGTPSWPTAMRENLKVGFFGDGGIKDSSKAVLNNLIGRGADFIIHAGDFDYECTRESAWKQVLFQLFCSLCV